MSATTGPPQDVASSPRPRIFGARPFHTDGDLLALGFVRDGTLWSVEEPGVLRHWDVASRQQLDWHPLEELATLWAFSSGAALVAAASDELSVWETASGELLASWPQSSWVTAVAFRPQGDLLATGHDDNVVRIWDLHGMEVLRELQGRDRAVSALAFSVDGQFLASAGEGRTIFLWNVETGELRGRLVGHTDRIPALAWHPDRRRLVSAGWDTTARVWDVTTCEPIILLNSHAAQVHMLAFSPDGQWLACADSANAIHVWDANRNRTVRILRDHASEVRCLAFSPDGQTLASGGTDHVIHLGDAQARADQEEQADPLVSRTCVAVSPDTQRLFSLGTATNLRVWDAATGEPALELQDAPVLRAFALSPSGSWLAASVATGPTQSALGLWDARTGLRQVALEGQGGTITALAFAPDSTLLASAGFQSSDVWLWRVPQGDPVLLIPGAADGCFVEALAFHPQGGLLAVGGIDWLATSGVDGHVAVWDVAQRTRTAVFPGGARSVAFHPSGQYLAVASLRQTVHVWDVTEGRIVTDLIGHLDLVLCLAYSPDGEWLVTAGDDRSVRLWEARTGLQRGSVEVDTQIKAIAFTPDGKHLFTGNGNTSCYLLEVAQLLTADA
jgi:WD40 repeat protein